MVEAAEILVSLKLQDSLKKTARPSVVVEYSSLQLRE
jgi:hypothetical protein